MANTDKISKCLYFRKKFIICNLWEIEGKKAYNVCVMYVMYV